MNFSDALNELKAGLRVCREGWNGRDAFIFLVPGSHFEVNRPPLLGIYPAGTPIDYHAHIDMKTAQGDVVPWVASQTDLLAEDWLIVATMDETCCGHASDCAVHNAPAETPGFCNCGCPVAKSGMSDVNTGEISDGYHTFNELYDHRCHLFVALMRSHPKLSWRAYEHSDGSCYEDWFIAGMHLPTGDISYHLPLWMWGMLDGIKSMQRAPEWDGHTSADVVKRLAAWCTDEVSATQAEVTR